jgi:hypothetical protein
LVIADKNNVDVSNEIKVIISTALATADPV